MSYATLLYNLLIFWVICSLYFQLYIMSGTPLVFRVLSGSTTRYFFPYILNPFMHMFYLCYFKFTAASYVLLSILSFPHTRKSAFQTGIFRGTRYHRHGIVRDNMTCLANIVLAFLNTICLIHDPFNCFAANAKRSFE